MLETKYLNFSSKLEPWFLNKATGNITLLDTSNEIIFWTSKKKKCLKLNYLSKHVSFKSLLFRIYPYNTNYNHIFWENNRLLIPICIQMDTNLVVDHKNPFKPFTSFFLLVTNHQPTSNTPWLFDFHSCIFALGQHYNFCKNLQFFTKWSQTNLMTYWLTQICIIWSKWLIKWPKPKLK